MPVVVNVIVDELPDVGFSEHCGAGVPVPVTAQVKFTVSAKLLSGVTVTVDVAELPGATDAGLGALAEMVKSGVVAGLKAVTNASGQGTVLPIESTQLPPP